MEIPEELRKTIEEKAQGFFEEQIEELKKMLAEKDKPSTHPEIEIMPALPLRPPSHYEHQSLNLQREQNEMLMYLFYALAILIGLMIASRRF